MGRRYYLLVVGLVLIIIGLSIIIFWQRGFVQLQPILVPCEKPKIFASRQAEFSKIPPTPDCVS